MGTKKQSKKIKVLHVPIGAMPVELEVEDELRALQGLVGGYIEIVTLSGTCLLVCNEEGVLNGLGENRYVPKISQMIHGPFFLTGYDGEEFCDLPERDVEKYAAIFGGQRVHDIGSPDMIPACGRREPQLAEPAPNARWGSKVYV